METENFVLYSFNSYKKWFIFSVTAKRSFIRQPWKKLTLDSRTEHGLEKISHGSLRKAVEQKAGNESSTGTYRYAGLHQIIRTEQPYTC